LEPTARSSSVVKCEKHGLHYDSAKTGGCVVCRRESGELPPYRPGNAAAGAAAGSGSLPATAVGMQMVHGAFTTWLRETGNPSAYESGNTYQQKQMDGVLQELKEQGADDGAPVPEGEEED
jgi:hypothetical protein